MSAPDRAKMRGRGSGTGRRPWALLVAGALVVLVVAAVLLFGVHRPPELATVADGGVAPPGAVAWTRSDGSGSCLRVAWPDGSVTEPWCDPQGGEVTAWPRSDGVRVVRHGPVSRVLEIDPHSGEVLETREQEQPPVRERPEQPRASTFREGDELVVLHGDTELWRVPAPPNYDVRWSAAAPDGDWLVLADAAERLLVVPSDGSADPRVWASDVEGWGRVVWHGEGGG